MKRLLLILTLIAAATAVQTATLDVTGVLYADDGIRQVPLTLAYSADPAGAVPVDSVVLQMPFQYDPQPGYDPAAFDWEAWPELVFDSGVPVSLAFTALNPFPGVWRLGVDGPLAWDNDYGEEIIEGWSIQAFLDTPTVRIGLASMPAPAGLLCPIPEPMHGALMGGVGLVCLAAWRRQRKPTHRSIRS